MANETIFYPCALGVLKISAENADIIELTFVQDVPEHNAIDVAPTLPVLKICVEQLDAYFDGKLQQFTFSCRQHGTQFQQSVWSQLSAIPFGKTISYLDLSKKLGNTKAIRAAASANGKNVLAIVVPCHRVIGSSGSLVGYAGELWRKQWLLNHEARYALGVQFLF